ncbi:hypothetical protein IMSHALPRED_009398 [Imshaugia aleurites]|uniref:Hemerythrin-like domain-containing protein n=1 Tax=Imshaugia aleurites TaxID=172621 RepID=A0A8H3FZM5_9LECA|nr:hypothetical protein IMSHALPRED_009398 [Imshaugia aleurites]
MAALEPIVSKLSGDPAHDEDQRTISEAIGADHGVIDLYAENIKTASTLQEKIEWRNQFTWALARHAVSEELTLYPVMEDKLGQKGKELADVDRGQHMAVKKDLYQLQDMSPDNKNFFPLLDTLLTDLHEHIEHESQEDMPRLEEILSREESKSLANYFEKTKLIIPTRSHPSAPNKPYFENFAAMLAAPIDKFMDLLRAFPEQGKLGDVSASEAPSVVQKS